MVRNPVRRWRVLPWGLLGLTGVMFVAQPTAGQRARRALPPLSAFAVIEEKNLFHPDRIPQIPPPLPAPGPSPSDLARTHFVLQGVVLMEGSLPIALLQEPKLTEKKVKPFTQGEKIGPYVLKAVKPNRVILALGDKEFVVLLHKPKKPSPPSKRPKARKPRRPKPKQ